MKKQKQDEETKQVENKSYPFVREIILKSTDDAKIKRGYEILKNIFNYKEENIIYDLIYYEVDLDKYEDINQAIFEGLGHKKITITNGVNKATAFLFLGINMFSCPNPRMIGGISYYNATSEAVIVNINEALGEKLILTKDPNKEDTYFYFFNKSNDGNTPNTFREERHRLFASHKLKAMSYIIGKNACSSVVAAFYRHDIDPNTPADWIPWNPPYHVEMVNRTNVRVLDFEESNEKFKDYKKFIVVRDPVEKFVSLCNFSKDPRVNIGLPYNTEYINTDDKKAYIDQMIEVCRGINLIDNTYYQDEHYMHQCDQLKDIDFSDVDFVRDKDLDYYFEHVIGGKITHSNKSREKFITVKDISPEQALKIYSIYERDYEFLANHEIWNRKAYELSLAQMDLFEYYESKTGSTEKQDDSSVE